MTRKLPPPPPLRTHTGRSGPSEELVGVMIAALPVALLIATFWIFG